MQMRSKNDQLAAVLDDRAEFVTRLSSNPQFVVMGIEKRNNPLVLPTCVADVDLAADGGSTTESILDIPGEESIGDQLPISATRNDAVQRNDSCGNELDSRLDQFTRRCLDLADSVFDAGECA